MTPRSAYDRQLELLGKRVAGLADTVFNAMTQAMRATTSGEVCDDGSIEESGALIGDQEREVETLCLKIFLQQQPVATDLRDVSSALKMVTDLRRIGEQAIDICRVIREMRGVVYGIQTENLSSMAEGVGAMVEDAIDAYLARDLDKATGVVDADDHIDELFVYVRTEIIDDLCNSCIDAEDAIDLLMTAKYLERIGDHAVNVAGWSEYAVKGTRLGRALALDEVPFRG